MKNPAFPGQCHLPVPEGHPAGKAADITDNRGEPVETIENTGQTGQDDPVYFVESGQLDAIRTSFQSLPNPTELETQLDLLHGLCLQNEKTE